MYAKRIQLTNYGPIDRLDIPRPVPKLGPAGIDERTASIEIRRNSSTRTGYAAAANT